VADLSTALGGATECVGTIRLTPAGATIRLSGRVRPEERPRVEAEMRRRIAGGLVARGIRLIVAPAMSTPPR
jgi:hypothetical protein